MSLTLFHGFHWPIVALSLLLASATAQTQPPIRSLPMPEARVSADGIAEGNLWMSWSPDHKLGLVQGLIQGLFWGYFDGCTEASLIARSVPNLDSKCRDHIPAAHLKSDQYVALMTEFYSKYPEDRALPMRRLLMKLLEPNMTVDRVHKWLDELIESVRRSQAK